MSYYRRSYLNSCRSAYTSRAAPKTEVAVLRDQARKNAREFVLNKFFSLSPSEFSRYSAWYFAKHGASARDYLLKTYPSWKSRLTGMSAQTGTRVLEGVPKIMSRSEQFHLLRFFLPCILRTPREIGQNSIVDSSKLGEYYVTAGNSIISRSYDLD